MSGKVMDIQDLQHLESVVDKAGSSLLVVFFYTRSCGVCKELLRDFQQLCEEVSALGSGHHLPRLIAWQSLSLLPLVLLPYQTPNYWLISSALHHCVAVLQAKSQKIRAVFARHNLLDDFDYCECNSSCALAM